ncbi:MAG: HNH endonuclease [bacterium]|nr:HNH endonuclease [bacterium]
MSRQHRLLNRQRWTAIRRVILQRDGWRCQQCGLAGRLEVDHIETLEDGGDPWALDNCRPFAARVEPHPMSRYNRVQIAIALLFVLPEVYVPDAAEILALNETEWLELRQDMKLVIETFEESKD